MITEAEFHEIVPHDISEAKVLSDFYEQNESLTDTAWRRDYFEHLKPEDFIDLLQQVNSMIRSGDAEYRQHFDGMVTGVGLHTYEIPDGQDANQLLKETWEVARGFLCNAKLSDEDALVWAGLTVAGAILYIHPFADGNGRSSRVVSHMMIEGRNDNTKQQLEHILDEDGRIEWSITPPINAMRRYTDYYQPEERVQNWSNNIQWENPGGLVDFKEFGGREDDAVDRLISSDYRDRALWHFLANMDKQSQKVFAEYTDFDSDGNCVGIRAGDALRCLVSLQDGGLGYAAQLSEAVRWAQADCVRRFLKVMQQDEPVKPLGLLGEDVSRAIAMEKPEGRDKSLLKVFGKYAINGLITPRDATRVKFEINRNINS